MINNYFKITFRKMWKSKTTSSISILSLALGLSVSFCLLIYILHEVSYDKMHHNRDNIYRIDCFSKGQDFWEHKIPSPVVNKAILPLSDDITLTRIAKVEGLKVKNNSRSFSIYDNYCVDDKFFKIFDINMLFGSKYDFGEEPLSVLVSKDLSLKLFGRANSVGETLEISTVSNTDKDKTQRLKIIGVYANNMELNSVGADIYLPLESKEILMGTNRFFFPDISVYFLANKNIDFDNAKNVIIENYKSFSDYDNSRGGVVFSFVPLKETYFIQGNYFNGYDLPVVDLEKIYIYSAITIIILLLSYINYLLLSISKYTEQKKEFGIRKVIGARRKDIFIQILVDAITSIILSLPLSFIFAELLMPFISEVINKNISQTYYHHVHFLIYAFILAILIGIICGLFVAITYFKKNPIDIIKKKAFFNKNKIAKKYIFIFIQMIICSGLLISALVLNFQMKFISNKDLGFDFSNIIRIYTFKIKDKGEDFFNEIKNYSGIVNASSSFLRIPYNVSSGVLTPVQTLTKTSKPIMIQRVHVNMDELKLLKIKMVEGGINNNIDFSHKIIINQSAAKVLGLNHSIGKKLKLYNTRTGEVIGVVKDFNFNSIHSKIKPLILFPHKIDFGFSILIKYNPARLNETITFLKNKWKKFSETPLSYEFSEDVFEKNYASEIRLQNAINFFTLIAITISIMGLFGLILFSTQQKTKEIGIRKVVGASTINIFSLLTKDYFVLMVMSFVISSPIAYFFMKSWLNNFAYKINLGIEIFLYAYAISLIIVFFTISIRVFKTATANPVESLKDE